MLIKPWTAAILQVPIYSVADAADKAEARRRRLAKIDELEARIAAAVAEAKPDLVLLPEFSIAYVEENLLGLTEIDGPERDRLSAIAQKYGIFLTAMLYVTDPRFPGRYFNASLLFGESGEVLATYYRLITNHSSSPHDFWQRYLDVVGPDGAFPVVSTRLGKLAMMSSMELMYPEVARRYMLRGTETLLHLTAYSSDRLNYMSQARAHENMMYLLSASANADEPTPGVRAGAAVDWRGNLIGEASPRDPRLSRATIDIAALRTARATPLHDDYVNLLSRLRTEIFRGQYEDIRLFPVDDYVEGHEYRTKIAPETYPDAIDASIANMRRAGLLPPLDQS